MMTGARESAMVCYFGSWATYRYSDGKFDVENIDPSICTHAVYGFAGLNTNNTIAVLDPYNDLCDNYGKCGYNKFTGLKDQNAALLTLLGVGGWNEGSTKYSYMASTAANRQTFIESTIRLLLLHNFDGIDFDWQYPTLRGGVAADRENFISLLSELRGALDAVGLILTVGVSAVKTSIDSAYDIPSMAQYVDLVNLMTYDFYGAWDPFTQHQSGLYAYPGDTGDSIYLTQNFSVNYWIEGGMPSTKITLGIPLFARCWSLDSETVNGYYAPAQNPGPAGPYTQTPGLLGYNELCDLINKNSWPVLVAEGCNEPYTYSAAYQKIWCSFENHDSVAIKAQYAKDNNLAGLMVWSLETEDFHGYCSSRPYDLIKTMNEVFDA